MAALKCGPTAIPPDLQVRLDVHPGWQGRTIQKCDESRLSGDEPFSRRDHPGQKRVGPHVSPAIATCFILTQPGSHGDSRSMRWPRLTETRVIFGIATLLSLYSAFQAFQYVAFFAQRPTSIRSLLGLNSGYWYTWALLAPVVIWLSRRFPLDRESWRRSLPVRLVAIIAVTLAHLAMAEAVSKGLMAWFWNGQSSSNYSYWNAVRTQYFRNFDWEMMTYWAIVGASPRLRVRKQAQDRTLIARAARNASRRGAVAGAAAAAPPAFSLQHAATRFRR